MAKRNQAGPSRPSLMHKPQIYFFLVVLALVDFGAAAGFAAGAALAAGAAFAVAFDSFAFAMVISLH